MLGYCPWQHCTVKMVPVSAFSGRPPSVGGLKRGSRQVPVQRRGRIDVGVRVRLLVRDQRAVRGGGAVDARLPARLPEHFVAAEEREVQAVVARRSRRCARWPLDQYSSWPTDRNALWFAGFRIVAPLPIRVDAADVADVVAVRLEPAHHRVFGVEQPSWSASCRGWRAAGCSSPCRRGSGWSRAAGVEAVAAVAVVGLPGRSPTSGTAGRMCRHRRARRRRCGSRRRCRGESASRCRCPRSPSPVPPTRPTPPSCRSRRGRSRSR